jgi:predicted dehydrogenase
MARREIGLGIVGCGLMGRELASAAARWCHLGGLDFAPKVVAACDVNPRATAWFAENVPGVELVTEDYREVLAAGSVEAVYVAVPHNLHQQVYCDAIRAGKHLLGEKPFGIDIAANRVINDAIRERPELVVRCSSQFPFHPGSRAVAGWAREGRFGRIIEVEAGFWHSSDLNPQKPMNWKRRIEVNGEYGCMGDLGMHVFHLPVRLGWKPRNVRALLSNIMTERPDGKGGVEPCRTWDNAILACEATAPSGEVFPMTLSTKRIAPGQGNTWFVRVMGTSLSAEFSTKNPKRIRFLEYSPGGEQVWGEQDLAHKSYYASITGSIFEFGFSDCLLQMYAAFFDEVANGENMRGDFRCATPEEVTESHKLFTAALESQKTGATVAVE